MASVFGKLLNKNVPHILEMIFLSLDYQSFKMCHKVCNAWSKILGTETFKRRSKVQYHDEMVDELFSAAYHGNSSEVQRLLSIGISANVTKNFFTVKTTPLMVAIIDPIREIDVVKVLLKAGADPNATNQLDMTPLHEAATYGYHEAVKILLDQGADPNKVNFWGKTALKLALESYGLGLYQCTWDVTRYVVKLLIDGGSQPGDGFIERSKTVGLW